MDVISGGGAITRKDLLDAAAKHGIYPRDAEEILEKLRVEGIVYCPRHGEYKVV